MLGGYLTDDFSADFSNEAKYYLFSPIAGERVELYYAGIPTGIFGYDNGFYGDFGANDGVYAINLIFSRRGLIDPGAYPLEARIKTNQSQGPLFPYVHINY